jgi:hypothetical protein
MDILHPLGDVDDVATDPVLVIAFDGWTDAGAAGSAAADVLLSLYEYTPLLAADPDELYDYRDRRPALVIDRGQLGEPQWPELLIHHVVPPTGPDLLLVVGGEPDLRWRTLGRDLVEVAKAVGARRYVGLGGVPGPVPHTRPVQIISTSSDQDLLARFGRPHEQVIVPASCQVVLEALLRSAGLTTLGLWARLPHYVATAYPAATRALLERFSAFTGTPVDVTGLDAAIATQQQQLDEAASASDEITEHIRSLEGMYDAMLEAERQQSTIEGSDPFAGLAGDRVPSADEIAAEVERFLRGRGT